MRSSVIHDGLRILAVAAVVSSARPLPAADTAAEQPATGAAGDLDLFEKRIRPLLLERCVECHGGDSVEASLRLTTRDAVVQGGDSGPAALAGKPAESLIVQAVEYLGDIQMPPDGKLPESDIAALKQWVAEGMPMPEAPIAVVADPGPQRAFEPTDEHRRWWAFQPLSRPEPPAAAADDNVADWPRNEIDRFVLAGLRARGLAPAAEADRRTWLRRVTFDLTGLPPTEEELATFLADPSPEAHARVVDRLLASPAYGERQARRWLDVVRYADAYQAGPLTHPDSATFELTEAWRYRNWVVSAFNRDLPFDRFVIRQIAGDLVAEPLDADASGTPPHGIDAAGLAATTFLTIGSWDTGDADKEKLVSDIVDDQIDTVGKAFLGLTLGCARCHDHKFDPVSTTDYYALAGIFYSTRTLAALGAKGSSSVLNRVPLAPTEAVATYDEAAAAVAAVSKKLATLDARTPPPPADDPERVALLGERDRLEALVPPRPPRVMAVQEGGVPGGLFPGIQDVPLHVRGSYTRLGPLIPRRMPAFFAGAEQPVISAGSGRRELAAWVAAADNPLTPRVIANRVWQWHFGRGLVTTPSNFGMLAEAPSHPELLDWLARRLIDDGWSLKKLHRQVVLSATYRQSSRAEPAAVEADPDNRWLGRFVPRRLDAEEIRDAMLVAAGRLPAPAGEAGTGGPAAHDLAAARRSLYVQTTRWERGNFSTLFDAANPDASTEARAPSTVAPQALFLLNDDFMRGIDRDLVARLFAEAPGTNDDAARARIARAWRIVLGRPPRPEEVAVAWGLVRPAATPGGATPESDAPAPADGWDGWADLAHVLVCGNEFFHVE